LAGYGKAGSEKLGLFFVVGVHRDTYGLRLQSTVSGSLNFLDPAFEADLTCDELQFCETGAHEQFLAGDVVTRVGCEKHHGLGDLLWRAKPAERKILKIRKALDG